MVLVVAGAAAAVVMAEVAVVALVEEVEVVVVVVVAALVAVISEVAAPVVVAVLGFCKRRGSCFVDHIGLELVVIPLPQPSKCWDSSWAPSCLATSFYFLFIYVLSIYFLKPSQSLWQPFHFLYGRGNPMVPKSTQFIDGATLLWLVRAY